MRFILLTHTYYIYSLLVKFLITIKLKKPLKSYRLSDKMKMYRNIKFKQHDIYTTFVHIYVRTTLHRTM